MYLIGDKIVHPLHGAGVIEEITEERLQGKLSRFYVFHMPTGGLTLKIPTENCSAIGVRGLSTPEHIESIVAAMPTLKAEMNDNWNHRYRENMQRLKSGDLMEVARVIKGLVCRSVGRTLSNGERKMLHSAKQILLSEVVLVKDMTYGEAERWIESAMLTETE